AEDGIRDPLVTGVQTCALPIFMSISFRGSRYSARWTSLIPAAVGRVSAGRSPRKKWSTETTARSGWTGQKFVPRRPTHIWATYRSEERRVGKEGRERGRGGAR